MFKPGKGTGFVVTFVVVVLLCLYGDFNYTKGVERDLRRDLQSHDIVGSLADRVRTGMDRAMVEELIAGYQRTALFEAQGELTCIYRYWYGVLPPLPFMRYKISGKISVTYSADSKVTEVRHWYN